MNIIYPYSLSPSIKLEYGYSASGNLITKSVSIRNVEPETITDNTKLNKLFNIMNAITPIFNYPIYRKVITVAYEVIDD